MSSVRNTNTSGHSSPYAGAFVARSSAHDAGVGAAASKRSVGTQTAAPNQSADATTPNKAAGNVDADKYDAMPGNTQQAPASHAAADDAAPSPDASFPPASPVRARLAAWLQAAGYYVGGSAAERSAGAKLHAVYAAGQQLVAAVKTLLQFIVATVREQLTAGYNLCAQSVASVKSSVRNKVDKTLDQLTRWLDDLLASTGKPKAKAATMPTEAEEAPGFAQRARASIIAAAVQAGSWLRGRVGKSAG